MLRAVALACTVTLSATSVLAMGRPLQVDDIFALRDVEDPRISPDGASVAYTVTTLDAKKDGSDTDVYLASLAGGDAVRITGSDKAETSPRFSPDGKWLAFLSEREGKETQVWLLPLAGGEARKLTDLKSSVSFIAWSPDSTRLALVTRDADPDEVEEETKGEDKKTPQPILVKRRQFKRDGTGYLSERRHHLHVVDVRSKTSFQLTSGAFDDGEPAWSPDGRSVAFTSNRTPDPDSNQNTDIFVVDAYSGAVARAVATTPGEDRSPAWSPDGKTIAYVAGGDPKDLWYGASHLALVPAQGGPAKPLTAVLDRNVFSPRFSADGTSIFFLIEDGGNQHLARVPVSGGSVERVVAGEREVLAFDVGPKDELVFLENTPQMPPEVSALRGNEVRRVTKTNADFLKNIALGEVRRLAAKSPDGTAVDGFVVLPPGYRNGEKVAAILWPHGGPASQYSTGFDLMHQVLAAAGYAVIAPNPRGSTGYGTAFSRAIWADWGNKDYMDVMAAVDAAVAAGIADPGRLGVGGWSYGGIMTDYIVTKTSRFKAAASGASMANMLAGYGTDHYQYEWEAEVGLPWKAKEAWLKLSSSFFEVEKITTPILYMCGERDMNVPLLATEQLYQAVKRLGKVETELVVYPGQWHGIETPSYRKDRLERYLAWFDKHLRPGKATAKEEGKPEARSLLGTPLFPPEIAADARKGLEENLAKAQADFIKNPDNADSIIWLGRRLGYLGRFRDAIDVVSRGITKFPEDIRMYRHRGHRYITVREFDKAIADLGKAAELIVKKKLPDAMEPDGAPNARNIPTSTSHFNVYYHLGLAHYLKGDFAAAETAYRECMKYSKQPDSLVATSDWLYMTLRRASKQEEAAKVLEPIRADLDVIESTQYLDRLLLYKGEKKAEDLLGQGGDGVGLATSGYGVGNWYLVNGENEKAREVFRRVVSGPQWPAFGFIAAEADLARMK